MKKVILLVSLLAISCEGDNREIRREETRYAREFPSRELRVAKLESLTATNALIPASREQAYQLDPRVGVESDFYVYTVFTPHGTYTVKGLFNLPEHCREARVIEMILSSRFSAELKNAGDDYETASKNPRIDMLIAPVDSIQNLGRTFHRQGEEWENNTGKAMLDGIDRSRVNPAATVRQLAYHLRVDAWSTNSALTEWLAALAVNPQIREALMPRGEFFVPAGDTNFLTAQDVVAAWGKRWAAPGGKSAVAERFLRDEFPENARRELVKFYADNLKLDAANPPLKNLLANRSYSLRQQVYIAWYLAQINVRNTADALNYLSLAPTAFRADYNFTQLALLHALHLEYAEIREFAVLQNQIGAFTNNRQLIVIPLWDHPRNRVNVLHLLEEMNNFAMVARARGQALWWIGDCDEQVSAAAAERQIAVRQNVAVDYIFRFTPLRALTYGAQSADEIVADAMTMERDPERYVERVNRPVPIYKMPPRVIASEAAFIDDEPWWNGRMAIEKKLPKPAAAEKPLNETGSPSGKLPAPGRDPAAYPARDRLQAPPPKFKD